MPLPGVIAKIIKGGLGAALTMDDNVVAMVLTGATEGSVTVGVPFSITSPADLTTLGVTATNAELTRQVNLFYQVAPVGTRVWILLQTSATTWETTCDKVTATGVNALLGPSLGKIRMVILGVTPTGALDDTSNYMTLLNAGVTKLASTLDEWAFTHHSPARAIVCICGDTASAGDATYADLNSSSYDRVGYFIGSDQGAVTNDFKSIPGLIAGLYATLPVQRKPSRVLNGPLPLTQAYIKAATVESFAGADAYGLHDKGYITIRKHPNLNGYYLTSDFAAVSSSDDFKSLARGRIIDKAHRIAHTMYVQQLDDEVPIAADGTIDTNYAMHLEGLVANQLELTMRSNNEISGYEVKVPRDQNVIATNKVVVNLSIVPVGYASSITVNLGFFNPAK